MFVDFHADLPILLSKERVKKQKGFAKGNGREREAAWRPGRRIFEQWEEVRTLETGQKEGEETRIGDKMR